MSDNEPTNSQHLQKLTKLTASMYYAENLAKAEIWIVSYTDHKTELGFSFSSEAIPFSTV